MDLVDRADAEHAKAIAKILDLAKYPHHCKPTERVLEDLITVQLSKGAVLDCMITHLKNPALPIYCELQTMYEKQSHLAYIFCPLAVGERELYVKVFLPPAKYESQERLVILSVHPPNFPCPGAKRK